MKWDLWFWVLAIGAVLVFIAVENIERLSRWWRQFRDADNPGRETAPAFAAAMAGSSAATQTPKFTPLRKSPAAPERQRSTRAAYAKAPDEIAPPAPRRQIDWDLWLKIGAGLAALLVIAFTADRCSSGERVRAEVNLQSAKAAEKVAEEQTGAVRDAANERAITEALAPIIEREVADAVAAIEVRAQPQPAAPGELLAAPSDDDFAALYALWRGHAERVRGAAGLAPAPAPDRDPPRSSGPLSSSRSTSA